MGEDRLLVLEQRPVEEMFDRGQIQDLITDGHANAMFSLNDFPPSLLELVVEGETMFTFSAVENTPKGKFSIGKSELGSTSTKDI